MATEPDFDIVKDEWASDPDSYQRELYAAYGVWVSNSIEDARGPNPIAPLENRQPTFEEWLWLERRRAGIPIYFGEASE